MITQIEQREIFHLAFLRQLASKIRPLQYALKGGVNLRFFFGSIRYSEDMDMDVKDVETFMLKDIVMDILNSKTLQISLRPFNVEKVIPPNIKAAKQTETTQRFKIHLINAAGEDIFTMIEFSKRGMCHDVKAETVDDMILRNYKLPPLIVPHYTANAAIAQKIDALANRRETQARDVFDLYMLMPRCDKSTLKKIPEVQLKKACQHIFELDFNVFRDTVLGYLGGEDKNTYNNKEAWEDIQLKVSQLIS